ncbi:MFS transporter [Corynebacterium riegelii]|uniref:MFS transporter n=1 Tax=Corynebacterium riegelii TaxID=156976 RepID=UPI0023F002D8|nr:MFS transporter [Corynebacterium riegelii]
MAGAGEKGAGVVLLFGMFQVVLGSTLPSGLYAIYEREWDLSRVQTTLVFASYVAGVLFSLIFLGSIADRFGRKPAILLSVTLGGLSSIAFLVATGLPWLVIARLLSGLSVGLCTGAFTSALGDYYGRSHGSALSAVVTSAALAFGPLASALLAVTLPMPLRVPFIVHLMLLAIVLIGCLRIPAVSAPRGHAALSSGGVAGLFPTKSALLVFLCSGSVIGWAYGTNGMWQSVVPLSLSVVDSQLQIASITALMLGVSAVAQWVTLKQQPKAILPFGLVILAFGLAAAAYGVKTQLVWLLIAATVLVGVGQGIAFRSSLGLAASSASPHKQATVISLYYIFGYLMTAGLPLLTNISGVIPVLSLLMVVTVASLVATRLVVK